MSLISDIADYLATNGLGTVGTDIFYSYVPDIDGNLIAVLDTGGPTPSVDIKTLKNPTFQIFIRNSSYSAGKTNLDTIRSLLHQVIETTIGSTYFLNCFAQSEGGHIGRNERDQDEFSINFIAKTR